jgi:hypothetical protein
VGGDRPKVTALPINYFTDDAGPMVFTIYKVEGKQGTTYIDHQGNSYESLDKWKRHNDLPPGKVAFAKDMALDSLRSNKPQLEIIDTDPNGYKKTMSILKYTAMGLGVAGLVAATGGYGAVALSLLVASGTVGAAHGAEQLRNMNARGEDIWSWSNPNVVHAWFELGSSAASVVGGAAFKAAQLAPGVSRTSNALIQTSAMVNATGFAIDNAAVAYLAKDLYQNWENLSPAERSQGMAQLAFHGALGYGMPKALGGSFFDGFNVPKMRQEMLAQVYVRGSEHDAFVAKNLSAINNTNQIPDIDISVPIRPDASLKLGEMRANYDQNSGKFIDITYHPGSQYTWAEIAVHLDTATRNAGSLRKRASNVLREKPEPVASADRDATLEINKLALKASVLENQLISPSVSASERWRINAELIELKQQIQQLKSQRSGVDEPGAGFIAQPGKTNNSAIVSANLTKRDIEHINRGEFSANGIHRSGGHGYQANRQELLKNGYTEINEAEYLTLYKAEKKYVSDLKVWMNAPRRGATRGGARPNPEDYGLSKGYKTLDQRKVFYMKAQSNGYFKGGISPAKNPIHRDGKTWFPNNWDEKVQNTVADYISNMPKTQSDSLTIQTGWVKYENGSIVVKKSANSQDGFIKVNLLTDNQGERTLFPDQFQ